MLARIFRLADQKRLTYNITSDTQTLAMGSGERPTVMARFAFFGNRRAASRGEPVKMAAGRDAQGGAGRFWRPSRSVREEQRTEMGGQ